MLTRQDQKPWAAAAWFIALAVLLSAHADEPFHGNTRSHVFHQSSCRYYSCPNCTARFGSAREAIDAGYRPCGLCDPAGARTQNPSNTDAQYFGNTSSHKFHRASCKYAGCANCTAKFKTREEAIKAGYVPGGCCNP
jgi:hypothetical protein